MSSDSSTKPHVLIGGAGIAGLFLAQFLRRNGAATFAIYERDPSPSARPAGWAIGLSMNGEYAKELPDDLPSLRSTCHLLPLDLPSQFILYPPGGARIGTEDAPETPCVRATRGKLRNLLSAGVPIHWGKQAVGVTESADGSKVTLTFADGTSATGDLVVGADGTWSRLRESVLGTSNEETLKALPVVMIHGTTTLRGQALEDQLRRAHSGYIAIHPGSNFFCGLDTVEPAGDAARFYWFLYLADDHADAPDHWLRTASREAQHAHALERTAVFDPRLTHVLRAGGPAAVSDKFTLFYDAVIRELPGRPARVLLIGDAAHPTTPFRGEGGIVAIEDALRLSRLLAQTNIAATDDPAALRTALDTFQADVLARGSAVVQLSRDAIANASSSNNAGKTDQANQPRTVPSSWGYPVRPIPESTQPLGIGAGI